MNCIANHETPATTVYNGMSLCDEHFNAVKDKSGASLNYAMQEIRYGGSSGVSAEMKRRRGLLKNQVGGFSDPATVKKALNKRWDKEEA